jgi:hypothetical protein
MSSIDNSKRRSRNGQNIYEEMLGHKGYANQHDIKITPQSGENGHHQ